MDDLDLSAKWQARHPTHGSVGIRHLCANIVPGQRALTSGNGTFATDDNYSAAEAYERHFRESLERLHGEQRYRVFTDIERVSGRFPAALHNSASPTMTGTMWVSVGRTGSPAAWSACFVAAACRWCASRSAEECFR